MVTTCYLGVENTRLSFPSDQWDEIFTALQISILQLLVQFPGEKSLMPTQGGSSERHFVWVWEATFMLMPLLRLGHFDPVKRSLGFIYSLQDAGHPPEGELTTTAGAIGTTGPKWLNTTGAALALASEYYRYSKDESFLSEYLPKMLRAADWIVGEIRATRKLSEDGSRPLYYGLMPFGCATDGDTGLIVAFTDAFTFWGLDKTVQLLEQIEHDRAAEFRKERDTYHADLNTALRGMTREDGFIERKILTGKEKKLQPQFERIAGVLNLALTGVLDVDSDAFRRHVSYFEKNLMDGFFTGKMTRNIAYIGLGEMNWHHAYLRMGEWKKAFAANRVNLRYGMTQDTHQVQERFAKNNPAFTPWQPNGSGNGRVLEMILNSLYFEDGDNAVVFGAVPWSWLMRNGITELHNLYTTRGTLSIKATMKSEGECQVHITGALPSTIHFPNHFETNEGKTSFDVKNKNELKISLREAKETD